MPPLFNTPEKRAAWVREWRDRPFSEQEKRIINQCWADMSPLKFEPDAVRTTTKRLLRNLAQNGFTNLLFVTVTGNRLRKDQVHPCLPKSSKKWKKLYAYVHYRVRSKAVRDLKKENQELRRDIADLEVINRRLTSLMNGNL